MKSSTEVLRALLDERGVEWEETTNDVRCVFTWWESPTFGKVHAMDNEDGTLFMACLNNCDFTPEQAVAATLGETPTPHVEDLGRFHDELRDAIVEILGNRCDWDQAGVRHAHEVLERAATLGRGTCREVKIDRYWRGCGECGYVWEFMYGIGKCERPRYCPNCGRKVEE